MALFQPAENTSAFLKMGLMGFAGSGKTKTSALTAIGLVQLMAARGLTAQADKPVNFIDTETGSDWVKPDFDKAGIPLQIAKTRAFIDLLTAVRESEKEASVLIVDSITHFWKELTDSYVQRKAKERNIPTYRLQFQDWAYLKGEWAKFTDLFVNSHLHIIVAGRAGFEYDHVEDEDSGKKELQKTGVKMKAEGEMGYEPSLLIFMERHQRIQGNTVDKVWREANVLKDRSTLLDGKSFVDPKFTDFLPHIERLNLGGKHVGVDTSRTSEHAIPAERRDWTSTHRDIVLEEIEAILVEHYPSTKAEDKAAKAALVLKHFNTRSWTEVTVMKVDDLRRRFDALHRELKDGQPSRYTPKPEKVDLNDGLPDHSAAEASTAPAEPATPAVEAELLATLAACTTTNDCFEWGRKTAAIADLAPEQRTRLSNALTKRQGEILKAETAAGAAAETETDPKPSGGKPSKARRAAAAEKEPEPAIQAAPATYGYGQPYIFV